MKALLVTDTRVIVGFAARYLALFVLLSLAAILLGGKLNAAKLSRSVTVVQASMVDPSTWVPDRVNKEELLTSPRVVCYWVDSDLSVDWSSPLLVIAGRYRYDGSVEELKIQPKIVVGGRTVDRLIVKMKRRGPGCAVLPISD